MFYFPIDALSAATLGVGLWYMKTWARNLLMIWNGINIVRFVNGLLIRVWALGEPTLLAERMFSILFFVNLLTFLALYCMWESEPNQS